MNTAFTSGTRSLPSNTIAKPKGKLKAIITRSGLVLDGPSVPMPPLFVNLEEDKRVEETLTDPEHADLGASINLMPLSVWKNLGLPELISTQMTLKLANREICTPVEIARDVFVPVGKFTFPADFVIVNYESDPREEFKAYLASNSFHLGNDDLVDYSLEEFIDELTLITFPPGNDDLPVDAKSDL
ncbi:reverse transcriptase domain-containing protein [Tanacetum coccineum]